MDCNIKYRGNNDREMQLILKRAIELGWEHLVFNQTILAKQGQKIQIKPSNLIDLNPYDFNSAKIRRTLINSQNQEIKQYSRITLVVDDVIDIQQISASNDQLRQFDIVAVTPGNGKVLSHLCKSADVDLISIDFAHRVPFSLNKKVIDAAVARGISFELKYGTIFTDSSHRKEFFSGVKHLIKILRGRNLILSSGSESWAGMKGPFEAINVGLLLNLNIEQSKNCIRGNCDKLIFHGVQRKNRYSKTEIVTASDLKLKLSESLNISKSISKVSKPFSSEGETFLGSFSNSKSQKRKFLSDPSSEEEDNNIDDNIDANLDDNKGLIREEKIRKIEIPLTDSRSDDFLSF